MNFDLTKATTDPELQTIVKNCEYNILNYGRLVHEEDFFLPPSSIHLKLQKHIDRRDVHKKLVIAPRGIGKTTTVKAVISRAILYRKYRFIV